MCQHPKQTEQWQRQEGCTENDYHMDEVHISASLLEGSMSHSSGEDQTFHGGVL